jgi:hypothetical protein
MNMETPHGEDQVFTSIFTGVDPTDYARRGRWEVWFGRPSNAEKFNGDIQNAISLLVGLGEGIHYTFDKFKNKMEDTPRLPQFAFVFESKPHIPMVGTSNEGEVVFVRWDFLEARSKRDIHKVEPVHRKNEVANVASSLDVFRLAGVEEGHHSIFLRVKPESAWGPVADSSMTVAQYNARTIEYLPLIWQIRFAKERNLPPETIAHLEAKYREVRLLRVGTSS